jgi:hypothetical protein
VVRLEIRERYVSKEKYTESQIIRALEEADAGQRKLGEGLHDLRLKSEIWWDGLEQAHGAKHARRERVG